MKIYSATINKTTLIALIIIPILGFIVYANSLQSDFIWDDINLIRNNKFIKDWKNPVDIFTEDIGEGTDSPYYFYRPLQILTYRIDYSLWGSETFGFHLTNTILHILMALCIYWLLLLLFNDRLLALFTSILYIVHPVHTEAIAYLSGRTDPLGGCFLLLSFIFYIKYHELKKKSYFAIMAISYVIALLSRENSLILPLLLLCYHYPFKKRIKIIPYLTIWLITAAYIVIRVTILSHIVAVLEKDAAFTLIERLPGTFNAIINYVRLLILPYDLHMEYGIVRFSFLNIKTIAGIIVTIALIISALKSRKRYPLLSFALLWFFITLLLVLNIYPINAYMAEHWLYLPAIGFFLLLAKGLCDLYRKDKLRKTAIFLLAIITIGLSYLTIEQNKVWTDSFTFFDYTVKYAPTSWRVYEHLGNAFSIDDNHDEAIDAYTRAVYFNPDHIDGYYNIANELKKAGKYNDAVAFYKMAIDKDPEQADAYINLANTYLRFGNAPLAIEMYQKALNIDSENADTYFNLGNAYIAIHDTEKAIINYNKTLQFDPTYTDAYNNLGNTYKLKGDLNKATTQYKKAIVTDPAYARSYFNLGDIYRNTGKENEALEMFQKTVSLEPDYTKAHYLLAVIYFQKKDYQKSIYHCDKAAKQGFVDPRLEEALKRFRRQ